MPVISGRVELLSETWLMIQPFALLFCTFERHFAKPLFDSGRTSKSGNQDILNWYKMDSAHDFRFQYRVLSVRHVLNLKAVLFFWKWTGRECQCSLGVTSLQKAPSINSVTVGFEMWERYCIDEQFWIVLPLWQFSDPDFIRKSRLNCGISYPENTSNRIPLWTFALELYTFPVLSSRFFRFVTTEGFVVLM